MSHPHVSDDSPSDPGSAAWTDGSADETLVVRPPTGETDFGSGPDRGSTTATEHGGWSPSYSSQSHSERPYAEQPYAEQPHAEQPYAEQAAYSPPAPMTSVYPASTPGYAPAGYPPAYAPATVVPPPAPSAPPARTSSRVGAGFGCALLGLLLTAGGVLLAGRYGIAAAGELAQNSVVIKDSVLAALGALLVLGAVILNGWSPWATILPGVGLTGIGAWTLFDTAAAGRVSGWTRSVLSADQLSVWHISGFTLILGVALLASSVAATIARASGKRDGRILGGRQL